MTPVKNENEWQIKIRDFRSPSLSCCVSAARPPFCWTRSRLEGAAAATKREKIFKKKKKFPPTTAGTGSAEIGATGARNRKKGLVWFGNPPDRIRTQCTLPVSWLETPPAVNSTPVLVLLFTSSFTSPKWKPWHQHQAGLKTEPTFSKQFRTDTKQDPQDPDLKFLKLWQFLYYNLWKVTL